MAVSFDKPQQEAIDSREGNFLVSAGAGSGKTAVLTERIKELVLEKDPAKRATLDQLLVLTFTNKAAAEMKNRTRAKLYEAFKKGELKQDLSGEVECADITTFDSFFLKIVTKYAFKLGIDPDVMVAEESFLRVKERELIEEALSKRYEKMEQVFAEMVKKYTLKDDDIFVKYILGVLRLCSLSPNPDALFEELREKLYSPAFLDEEEKKFYEKCNKDLVSASNLLEGNDEILALDHEYVGSWIGLGSYEALYKRLLLENVAKAKKEKVLINGKEYETEFPKAPRNYEFADTDKLCRSAAKSLFDNVVSSLELNGDPTEQRKRILETKPYASVLIDIAKEVYQGMLDFMKEKNSYSFSDIASLARRLLDDKTILSEIKNKYKYIMIDEYQDCSDLQESFISSISNDNVFMVGDIKQSIYRFRNANPDIFAEKLSKYGKDEDGHAIYLQKNFRSRLEVIDFVNDLFGKIMSEEVGDVDYEKGQSLEFGNKYLYGTEPKNEFKATFLSYEPKDDLEKAEIEARAVANDIIDKVKNGFLIDVKDQGQRACEWGDFAILMPTKSQFNVYKKVFGEAKIPLVATVGNELDEDDLNMVFMRLLKLPLVIGEDEKATKHCYASIKRSYLFQEDDDKLFDELQDGSYKEDALIKDMLSDKEKLLAMGVNEAVNYLIEKYGFVEKLKKIGNVKANFKTLTAFLGEAAYAERMGVDYKGYVEHFDNLSKYGIKEEIKGDFAGDNVVKLMTIHASKGLEFPFVYCPNIARKTNVDDTKGFYSVSQKYGLLLPKTRSDDYSGNFLYSLYKEEEVAKAISEYMRLFYVQLTRASNQIIFIAPVGVDASFDLLEIPLQKRKLIVKTSVNSKGATVYSLVQPNSFAQFLNMVGKSSLGTLFENKDANIEEPTPCAKTAGIEPFEKPILHSIDCPIEIVEEKRASKSSFTPINEAAAQYGTHMHRLLELVSFKEKNASFITNDSERKKIEALFNHDIFDNLDGYKEFHEYRYIDYDNDLEGSIDLLLVKAGEKAIIVDYKTKHLDDEAYDKQLGLYKQYVEKVFGLKAETYLLSISDNILKVVE